MMTISVKGKYSFHKMFWYIKRRILLNMIRVYTHFARKGQFRRVASIKKESLPQQENKMCGIEQGKNGGNFKEDTPLFTK